MTTTDSKWFHIFWDWFYLNQWLTTVFETDFTMVVMMWCKDAKKNIKELPEKYPVLSIFGISKGAPIRSLECLENQSQNMWSRNLKSYEIWQQMLYASKEFLKLAILPIPIGRVILTEDKAAKMAGMDCMLILVTDLYQQPWLTEARATVIGECLYYSPFSFLMRSRFILQALDIPPDRILSRTFVCTN